MRKIDKNSRYLSIIGDMVKSRELTQAERPRVQKRFQELMTHLNGTYSEFMVSKFIITLGDEFQGILSLASQIPDLVWQIETQFPDRELRLGFGLGPIHTPIQEYAINMDGPSFHNARSALENAKKRHALGGEFRGFGALDETLGGIGGLLGYHRVKMTDQQRKIANYLRNGTSQTQAAKKLKITRQAVSRHVQSSGWQYYWEAETAWKTILKEYIDPLIGSSK
jgi:hypothetical protein